VVLRLLVAPLVAAVCTTAAPPLAGPPAATAAPTVSAAAPPEPVADVEPEPTTLASGDACLERGETRNGFEDDDGCPDEVPPDLAVNLGVVSGITFAIDKDIIKMDSSRATLDRLVDALTRHPGVKIEIGVHSDRESESGRYSRCLTCKRAEAIARYLVEKGVDRERVRHQGYGADRPIADDRTADGRRRNRRIEIHLLSDGMPVEAPSGCLDRRTLLRIGGTHQDCYPYVCRTGRCLTRCDDRRDCAGAQDPSELASQGWPLECMPGGDCTPMHPDKVR
jgi:outer membrane protein OmpA-like peptidoglycan-associated protein